MKNKHREATTASSVHCSDAVASSNGLSLPDITPIDSSKLCPRFTSILNRTDGVGVGIEEMDSLQMEVERMLVNVIQRNRSLTFETMLLDNDRGSDHSTILVLALI